jgi:hypothetical protein
LGALEVSTSEDVEAPAEQAASIADTAADTVETTDTVVDPPAGEASTPGEEEESR